MRKAYRITGSSFTKPDNLPEGFTVKERLVGEVLGTTGLVFHEVKDGSVVVYRQGVANSNVNLSPEEVKEVLVFLNRVYNSHTAPVDYVRGLYSGNSHQESCAHEPKTYSGKCPGVPHSGHASSDWYCYLDRA